MARIPILKLNNGETNYYPFSVCEATVTTHAIEVKGDIGSYKKGDTIPAVTTIDDIITKIFSGEGSGSVAIDGITITKDPTSGKIQVNKIGQDQVTGLTSSLENATNNAVAEAGELDEELHDTIDGETDAKLAELKFSSTEKIVIGTQIETAEAVKKILIKLGMLEENIKIDVTRTNKDPIEV